MGVAGDGAAVVALVEVEAGLLALGEVDEEVQAVLVDVDRLDRRLATLLDGIYHRGEFYVRWLERLTSINFGTETGRWITRNFTLPFLGAFLLAQFAWLIVFERRMQAEPPPPARDLAAHGCLENIFSTPLFSHTLRNADALNAELRDLILERERTTPSTAKSNIGGWQSDADFLRWGGDAVAALAQYLATATDVATARLPLVDRSRKLQFELTAWAAVNRKGHYNTSHVHPFATWSGVYYVDPGDDLDTGLGAVLEFLRAIVLLPARVLGGGR